MKYRLKKDLLWLKAGEILPNENSVLKPNFRCLYTIYRDNKARYTESMEICPEEYPDFFEPISEEDEKLEEAKKLLESKGYHFTLKTNIDNEHDRNNILNITGCKIKEPHSHLVSGKTFGCEKGETKHIHTPSDIGMRLGEIVINCSSCDELITL